MKDQTRAMTFIIGSKLKRIYGQDALLPRELNCGPAPSLKQFFQTFNFPQQNAISVTYRRLGDFLELCLNISSSLIIEDAVSE